jgi:hypothetical protein
MATATIFPDLAVKMAKEMTSAIASEKVVELNGSSE